MRLPVPSSSRAGSGSATPFAWTYAWSTILIPATLGWIIPWRAARLQRDLFNETHFGDKAFTFEGRSGPLYRRFWLVWTSAIGRPADFALALAAFGLLQFWKLPPWLVVLLSALAGAGVEYIVPR